MTQRIAIAIFSAFLFAQIPLAAQAPAPDGGEAASRAAVEEYLADRDLMRRRYLGSYSVDSRDARRRHLRRSLAATESQSFEGLSVGARVDRLLLANRIRRDIEEIDREQQRQALILDLVHFTASLIALEERRRKFEFAPAREVAATLDTARAEIEALRKKIDTSEFDHHDAEAGRRATSTLRSVERVLADFVRFRKDYDPEFGWWTEKPWESLRQGLRGYADAIEKKLVAARSGGDASLVGEPIGAAALERELRYAYIPYDPARLIAIAEREFAWCDAEMAKATAELGFEDWREAQNHVKSLSVAPGEQPALIRDLAFEAVDFIEKRDLVTVPALCKESWRMTMLSPAAQRVSPYFLGGEVIQVAYPTADMSHDEKLMSMRSNNPHFSRATVQHELIPGHHLQGYMEERYRPYRRAFNTPFWVEGWALYWEMRLWDLDFPRGPEDRIGMLFWRKHRCARIIFSLGFHSGTMSAQECVDFLVDRVGHERSAATAEVRRSIGGAYSPLYQAAYMLGGLQIRALHRDLVVKGKMSERAFHDAILQQNTLPIEMLRAILTGTELPKDHQTSWRFDG